MTLIFAVDNNYVYVEAQNLDGPRDRTVRLNYWNLMKILKQGKWIRWSRLYTSGLSDGKFLHLCRLVNRCHVPVTNCTTNADPVIIEDLEGQIARFDGDCTVCLVSGDGNMDDGENSFRRLIIRTLRKYPKLRWEVWAWRRSCNGVYKKANHSRFQLRYLDDYKEYLVFRSGERAPVYVS